MLEPRSALNGASYEGYVQVAEAGVTGMITLRGTLEDNAFAKSVQNSTGLAVPGQREVNHEGARAMIWMSTDELMLVCGYAEAVALCGELDAALRGQHALVANVSDARARFMITGPKAPECLAKVMPVDFAGFGPGMVRRSRLAQVPAAVWCSKPDHLELMVFRSVAQYAFDVLSLSAQPGSEVGVMA